MENAVDITPLVLPEQSLPSIKATVDAAKIWAGDPATSGLLPTRRRTGDDPGAAEDPGGPETCSLAIH